MWFIGASTLLVVLSTVSIAIYGFRAGIDLQGGTLWQVHFEKNVSLEELETYFQGAGLTNVLIIADAQQNGYIVRTNELPEDQHQRFSDELKLKFGAFQEPRFESIWPTVGRELRDKSLRAFFIVLFGISLYVAFSFRKVSQPVSSWKYGVVTLVTLFHDAIIPAGMYAWLGSWKGIEIDTNFIVAILVIVGFSVHDTIVVFDRIRENLIVHKGKPLDVIINESVNQTFARSVNTSLTLVLVLIAMYLFGATTLSYFILTILVGTVIGTYSSIFVASPLLTFLQKK